MHYNYFYSVREMQADYAKRIREFERQCNYERTIVCSVPESSAIPEFDLPTKKREDPG